MKNLTRGKSGGLVTRQVLQPPQTFQIYVVSTETDHPYLEPDLYMWVAIAESADEAEALITAHVMGKLKVIEEKTEQIGTAFFGPSRVVC